MSPGDQHRRPPVVPAGVFSCGDTHRPLCSSSRTLALLVITLALAVACGPGAPDSARDPARADRPETGVVRETVVEDAAEPEKSEDAFVASGGVSGGEAGAADRIEDVRFRIFDGYERLLIDFGGRDGETGVPRWSVESPEEGGYVRLRFPGVRSTQIAHEGFGGTTLDEIYVVRDRGGGLFADVFATRGFRYRVTEMPESGRLAVDLRGVPGGVRLPPTTGDGAVVLQPREAEEVESPVEVRGYARPFEGRVSVSILDRERETLASKSVRTNDWTSAYGLFETTIGFSGYEGLATIRVGSRSAKDGSFVGTETEVFLESSR